MYQLVIDFLIINNFLVYHVQIKDLDTVQNYKASRKKFSYSKYWERDYWYVYRRLKSALKRRAVIIASFFKVYYILGIVHKALTAL